MAPTRTTRYPHEHAQLLGPTMSYALHAIVGWLHIWPLAPGLSALRDGRSTMRRVVLPRVSARWLLEFEIASSKRAAD